MYMPPEKYYICTYCLYSFYSHNLYLKQSALAEEITHSGRLYYIWINKGLNEQHHKLHELLSDKQYKVRVRDK